eukprot:gene13431-18008_t
MTNLNAIGVPTHFIRRLNMREQLIREVEIIPLEVVERYVRGPEHRLLVVGGRVVAAARGEAAWVTGDGHSTVVQLIDDQLNRDPRRGTTEDHPLSRIDVGEDAAVRLDLQ